jgi:hypothetical protein
MSRKQASLPRIWRQIGAVGFKENQVIKVRITPEGELWLSDLGTDLLPICEELDPHFRPVIGENFTPIPNFQKTRKILLPINKSELHSFSTETLWKNHERVATSKPTQGSCNFFPAGYKDRAGQAAFAKMRALRQPVWH